MKLYVGDDSVQTCKLDAIVQTVKSKVERIPCKSKESPLKRLPAFELPDGDFLFSANAICRYLWTKAGKSVDSDDERWLAYESSVLLPTVAGILQGKKIQLNKDAFATPPKQNSLGYIVVCSTLSALSTDKNTGSILESVSPFYKKFASDFSKVLPKMISSESLAGLYVEPSNQLSRPAEVATEERKLSPEFINKALESWKSKRGGTAYVEKKAPILPEKGHRNVLITAALPYINNVPHLGNIVGSTLSADVFARFARLRGYNTLYVGGTDEYGTATETKALEMKCTPKELCDKFHAIHRDIYKWFNIGFDYFGRTSTPKQTELAQAIFKKLHANSCLKEESVDQLYCQQCPRFLADRFVEGTCPFCAYEDARGDQCDKCSKLINAIELKNPKCKLCKTSPVIKTSGHLFLDMPKLEPALRKWQENSMKTGRWTQTAKVITNSWLREGLRPRCLTRDLKWGIPVPIKGYEDKVFYVWFDAPIGYISMTATYTDQWEQWWKNPDNVELFQFLGKDNVPFHSIVFPMCLLGSGENFTKVSNIAATEYLNYEDTKFSKSRGVGVFGNDAKNTGIPSDIWRFYMMYLRPESQDTAFSWVDLQTKNNSELLNNLGNFVNRCLTFTGNNFANQVPPFVGELTEEDKAAIAQAALHYQEYVQNLEQNQIRDALRSLLSISKAGNQYIQSTKPWELVKNADTKARCGSILHIGVQICAVIAGCLEPFMPDTAAELRKQINIPKLLLEDQFRPLVVAGHKMNKAAPLFKKIETEAIEEFRKKFQGTQTSGGVQSSGNVAELEAKVKEQGDRVRSLKAAKADKPTVTHEVNILLDLKKQLEAAQKAAASAPTSSAPTGNVADLEDKVKKQGDKVRALKAEKADKSLITQEVNILLALKKDLEASQKASGDKPSGNADQLEKDVAAQGDKVRKLKTEKADKATIDKEVATLLDLKKQLAAAKGEPAPEDQKKGGKKKK